MACLNKTEINLKQEIYVIVVEKTQLQFFFVVIVVVVDTNHKNQFNYKTGRKSNQIERVNVFLYYWRYSTCHAVKKIRKSIFHCMSSSALLAKSLVNACKHRCIDTTGYSRYHTPTISCQFVTEFPLYVWVSTISFSDSINWFL